MAISKIGGGTSDNWELISSVTPTALSASVNFTGLTPYRKLLVLWDGTSSVAGVRLNNDSGSNYAYQNLQYNTSSGVFSIGYQVFGTEINTDGSDGYVEFGNCDMTGLKTIVAGLGGSTTNRDQYQGYYKGTSIISQVNVIAGTTFTATGIVYLYGVK